MENRKTKFSQEEIKEAKIDLEEKLTQEYTNEYILSVIKPRLLLEREYIDKPVHFDYCDDGSLSTLIEILQSRAAQGATDYSINMPVNYGDTEDQECNIEFYRMVPLEGSDLERLIATTKRQLIYTRLNELENRMNTHNRQIDEYQRLKKVFEKD